MRAGVWHRDTVGWVIAAAALPVAAAAVVEFGPAALWRMGIALTVVLFWQGVFLWTRAQPVSPIAVVTAVSVGVLAPGNFDAWQLMLAVSFGAVIGEQIFGGWGRNVINAGVATLAFLYFAFPETLHAGSGVLVALAVIPGALMLIATGIIAWPVIATAIAAAAAVSLIVGQNPGELVINGSLVFGLVFLVCDPVASSATRQGRWIYGTMAGALVAVFAWADTGTDVPQAIVFAALLASLLAPLIDAGVVAVWARQWRRRNG